MAIKRTKGKLNTPNKDLIYGVEGVGKSSLASTYPSPLFLDFEGSTDEMDVDRIPIESWDDFAEVSNLLLKSKDYYDVETVVFDTADWFEPIVISKILKDDGADSITDSKFYGFGAGDRRISEFVKSNIFPVLNAFLRSGRNVVIVAHALIKGIDDPIVGRYDSYIMKSGKIFSATIKEWCSNMFFLNFETHMEYKKGLEKNKAKGGRERFIHTTRTPQYEAKNRIKAPERMRFIEGKNPYEKHIHRIQINEDEFNEACNGLLDCGSESSLTALYNSYPSLKRHKPWIEKIQSRKNEILKEQSKTQENAK